MKLETDFANTAVYCSNPIVTGFLLSRQGNNQKKYRPSRLYPRVYDRLEADIHLTVNKKDPIYEVSGQFRFLGLRVPFTNLVIKNEYFLFHQQTFYFIERPELLRIIRFFKAYDEFLLIHALKIPRIPAKHSRSIGRPDLYRVWTYS